MHRFLLLVLVCLGGWSSPSRLVAAPSAQVEAQFQKLTDDFLAGYLAWRPGLGVALGLHEFDGRVTDYGRTSINLERMRLAEFDRRLEKFPYKLLSPRAAYDYRILRCAIRKQLFRFDTMRSYTRNPMSYAGAMDVNIYVKRNFAPLEERVRYIIAVLEQAPTTFAAARANLNESLPRPFIQTAIQVAEGSAEFLDKDLVEALSGLKNRALLGRFKVVKDRAAAEVREYAKWLKESRLPQANDDYALGKENFAQMLREGELIDLPPEQILEIGLRELRREQQLFTETAAKIKPEKKPVEVFKSIQKDHPTEQNLISDTRQNLEAIRQFLVDNKILTIPSEVRVRVEETPKFDRATSFASMDTPGPFERKATEAYYYVTPVEPEWPAAQKEEWLTAFNYYTTDVVSIHEAYPGHYVQFLCLNASPANRLEKILDSYAFVEGWAHYTEQMMLDAGFGPNMPSRIPQSDSVKTLKYRLAQSDEALLRLCRLCVAIKMHCQGMTVDEAAKFFQDNCYYEPKPARQEAIRGAFDPEFLYYTVGKLQFLKLRRDYEQQEGASFSLKKFHDECLRHGMPPIRLLREVMLKDPKLWDEVF